jgi:hypothetical protein
MKRRVSPNGAVMLEGPTAYYAAGLGPTRFTMTLRARPGAERQASGRPQAMARQHGKRALAMDHCLTRRIDDGRICVRVRFLGYVMRQMQRTGTLICGHGGTAAAPPAKPVRYIDRRLGALPELLRGQPGERPRRSVPRRVMRQPRDVDSVARPVQTLRDMLIRSGRLADAMTEDDDASGASAMSQENRAASRGGDAIVGALLPHGAAHGIDVLRSGRSVRYALGGVGRDDGGERNHENRPRDENRDPCHSATLPEVDFDARADLSTYRASGSSMPAVHSATAPRRAGDWPTPTVMASQRSRTATGESDGATEDVASAQLVGRHGGA